MNEFDKIIQDATSKYLDYDWRLYKAQLWQESRLDPKAKSPVGASGIAQFMPDTWSEWSPRAGFPDSSPEDPEASIFTGALYMSHLIEQWSWPRPSMDRYCLAMASYNAGLGHILEAQRKSGNLSLYSEIISKLHLVTGNHSKETVGYVFKILNFYIGFVTGDKS